jgi:hypothetical protein
MKLLIFIMTCFPVILTVHGQSVSISEALSESHSSAILDVSSATKGVLIPRMTMAQRDAIIEPAQGLLVYVTDGMPCLSMFNNSSWDDIATTNSVWSTGGNASIDSSTHFIGTTENLTLRFRVNNRWAGEVDNLYLQLSLGDSSGISNEGFYNSGYGHKTLLDNQYGNENTAVGYASLENNLASRNTGLGCYALRNNVGGEDNTALGTEALEYNAYGNRNTAIGRWALNYNLHSHDNTAVGYGALSSSTAGEENVAIGSHALYALSNGFGNIAIGYRAMQQATSVGYNIAVGYQSLMSNTTGYLNTAIGGEAMKNNVNGYSNTAVGVKALEQNTNGNENDAFGSYAMWYNTGGVYNVAVGTESLAYNDSGNENTALGNSALRNNNAGNQNTGIGKDALLNTRGSENTGVGYRSLVFNDSGVANTALGSKSMENNDSGEENVALGQRAMFSNVSGDRNTAVGARALYNNGSGSYNVAIGFNAGMNGTYYNTVSIGNHEWINEGSNQVFIGNINSSWIGGNEPWSVYSDARIKIDVREDVQGLAFIKQLRPVTYHRSIDLQQQLTGNQPVEDYPGKYDAEKVRISGFLAQEVETAATGAGYDFSGLHKPVNDHGLYSISYESFVVPLVKAVQEQQAMIEAQKQQLTSKDEIIEKQQAMIDALIEGYIDHEERLTAVERQKTK